MDFQFVGNDGCSSVDGVAVVVDVLRAYSFAAYALGAGVDRVILMDDLDETLRLAGTIPGALAGKDGAPADGFELFNSPGQILERSDLAGRTVVHRTTAGTIGAIAARRAEHLYCASFVVAGATVDRIRKLSPGAVTFVITGEDGTAREDLACAQYIVACLSSGAAPDPAPFLAEVEAAGARLRRAAELGYRGVHRDDVDLCMELDRFDFALKVTDQDGHLTLRTS